MEEHTKEKLIEGFKEMQYEKFNLCDVDLEDAQGANLMYAIEDTIKSTVAGINAYYESVRQTIGEKIMVKNDVVKLGKGAGSKGRMIYGVPADVKEIPDGYKDCECFFRTDKEGVFLTHMDKKLLYIQDKGIVCSV